MINHSIDELPLFPSLKDPIQKTDSPVHNIQTNSSRKIKSQCTDNPNETLGQGLDEGWVKLYRKIEKSAVFQNEGLLKVWIWCLIKANHEDRWVQVRTGRGTTPVLVKRGQFIYGRKTAAKALKMKEPTVQKRMMVLKNLENLITQSKPHYSLVTIIKWDVYQSSPNKELSEEVSPKYHKQEL